MHIRCIDWQLAIIVSTGCYSFIVTLPIIKGVPIAKIAAFYKGSNLHCIVFIMMRLSCAQLGISSFREKRLLHAKGSQVIHGKAWKEIKRSVNRKQKKKYTIRSSYKTHFKFIISTIAYTSIINYCLFYTYFSKHIILK